MRFFLDELPLDVDVPFNQVFLAGSDDILSNVWHDPTLACDWYSNGYSILPFDHLLAHNEFVQAVNCVVERKLHELFPCKDFSAFTLERYHLYVSEDEHRFHADPVLKRLHISDLPEISRVFLGLISDELRLPMGFDRGLGSGDHWIILRINPPYSYAYNPPHKDIYEDLDQKGYCPKMVNAWIPIAGVSMLAGLGLAPGSHLLPESLIMRCSAGSRMNGRIFSVNMIKSWAGVNVLNNVFPPAGSFLCFSSHLVHGLGVNRSSTTTTVALEFRLHQMGS